MTPLEQLVAKLEGAFSGRLVSVVLYGSAAAEADRDRLSDFNVLCVLKDITPRELAEGEPVLHWWTQQGNPPVLLMSEEEVYRSADSFPIEFHDMQRRRRVLFGLDVIADMEVHDTHYRAQVEHELRTALLRLRQQGAAVLSDPKELLALCAASVSTFCVLGRHVLVLMGQTPPAQIPHDRRGVAAMLKMEILGTLLDVREGKAAAVGAPVDLFAEYLVSIGRLIDIVDRRDGGGRP
jgi:hypothetical protein